MNCSRCDTRASALLSLPGDIQQERVCGRHLYKLIRVGLRRFRRAYPGVASYLFVPRVDYLLREDFQATVLTGVVWGT